ncbi:hypothetical protein Dimus_017014 [Dionaea muscipula]
MSGSCLATAGARFCGSSAIGGARCRPPHARPWEFGYRGWLMIDLRSVVEERRRGAWPLVPEFDHAWRLASLEVIPHARRYALSTSLLYAWSVEELGIYGGPPSCLAFSPWKGYGEAWRCMELSHECMEKGAQPSPCIPHCRARLYLGDRPSGLSWTIGLSSVLRGEVQVRQHARPQHAATAHWFLEKKRGSYVLIMEMGLAVGVRC